MMRRKRLDFVSIWECRLVLPTRAFMRWALEFEAERDRIRKRSD
jgi:hypothetical protein